jgi:hypothetical protein
MDVSTVVSSVFLLVAVAMFESFFNTFLSVLADPFHHVC